MTVSEIKNFLPGSPYEAFGEWVTDIKNWTELASNQGPAPVVTEEEQQQTKPVTSYCARPGAMRYNELHHAVRCYLQEKVGGNIGSGCAFSPKAAQLLAHSLADSNRYDGNAPAMPVQPGRLKPYDPTAPARGALPRFHSNVAPQTSPPVSKSLQASILPFPRALPSCPSLPPLPITSPSAPTIVQQASHEMFTSIRHRSLTRTQTRNRTSTLTKTRIRNRVSEKMTHADHRSLCVMEPLKCLVPEEAAWI